jgi:hypothetical protein
VKGGGPSSRYAVPGGGRRLQLREGIPFAVGVAFLAGWMRWSATHEFQWYSSDTGGTYLRFLVHPERFAVLSALFPNRWQPVARLTDVSIHAFR